MAEDQDDSQKTEEPSHKRLEEAFKKGQVANSREVNSFLMLFTFAVVAVWALPGMMLKAKSFLAPFITRPEDFEVDQGGLGLILFDVITQSVLLLSVPLLAAVAVAFGASLIQNPFHITTDPVVPKFEKISLSKGLKRMFSARSLMEFAKGIVKIGVIGIVAWIAIAPQMPFLITLPDSDLQTLMIFLALITKRIFIGVCIVMLAVALIDYFYQRYEHLKGLRMSKQELKDEYKQQEGDPLIKQRLRSIRMERARKRMMAAVPKADVVITNPTHYAIALRYNSDSMRAPVVVAKGLDNVALRIRESAEKHEVPIVENPPLARALYENVKLDQEIPASMYRAVAEVIGYVYRTKGRGLSRRTG